MSRTIKLACSSEDLRKRGEGNRIMQSLRSDDMEKDRISSECTEKEINARSGANLQQTIPQSRPQLVLSLANTRLKKDDRSQIFNFAPLFPDFRRHAKRGALGVNSNSKGTAASCCGPKTAGSQLRQWPAPPLRCGQLRSWSPQIAFF